MTQFYGSHIGFSQFGSDETVADDDRRDSDEMNGRKSLRFNVNKQLLKNTANVTSGRPLFDNMPRTSNKLDKYGNPLLTIKERREITRQKIVDAREKIINPIVKFRAPVDEPKTVIRRIDREKKNKEITRRNKILAERLSNIKSTIPNCR